MRPWRNYLPTAFSVSLSLSPYRLLFRYVASKDPHSISGSGSQFHSKLPPGITPPYPEMRFEEKCSIVSTGVIFRST